MSERPQNLVLTGFMATGKSTLGPRVAQALGLPFFDTDTEIVAMTGLDIPRLFARHGEAHFRQLEAQVCARLAQGSDQVIATGGGTFLEPANQFVFRSSLVVCLTADLQVLAQRLQDGAGRPLAAQWRDRWQERQALYAALPHHLDTSRLTVEQGTQALVELWRRWR